jgi:hypothetical protein
MNFAGPFFRRADKVDFVVEHFPHAIRLREERAGFEAWLDERHGPAADGRPHVPAFYVRMEATWCILDDTVRFNDADAAFEFKMRWG